MAAKPAEKTTAKPAAAANPPSASRPKPFVAKTGSDTEKTVAAATAAVKSETTVRVDTGRLDDIMNLVGELVLARNRLMTLRASFQDEKVVHAVANLDLVTADLQGAVMKTRMQPIKKVFWPFSTRGARFGAYLGKTSRSETGW